MRPKRSSAASDQSQRDRFIAMAKEVGADDDEATFRAKLGAISKAKPVEDPRDFPSTRKPAKKAKTKSR